MHRLAVEEVELPVASAGGEQCVAVVDVANGLTVVAAAAASGEVHEHEP